MIDLLAQTTGSAQFELTPPIDFGLVVDTFAGLLYDKTGRIVALALGCMLVFRWFEWMQGGRKGRKGAKGSSGPKGPKVDESEAAKADGKARKSLERAKRRAVSRAWELAYGHKLTRAERRTAEFKEFDKWYRATYRD